MEKGEKKIIKQFKIYVEEIDELFLVSIVEAEIGYQMVIDSIGTNNTIIVRYDDENEILKILAEAVVMNYRFVDVINGLMEDAMEEVEDDEEVL